MTIRVITQTTEERKQETMELYTKLKPHLDNGESIVKAIQKVKNINHKGFCNQGWYRDVRDLAIKKGYKPKR